jgi:gamma-glutamylcyclotransferase (GGCT)/AIG2-like uncharacterized protein YtfP
MQLEPSCVFVYGTLKRGEARERFWPRPPLAVETATVRGTLYDLGAFPALTVGDGLVEGELWHLAARDLAETLAALDRIEGHSGTINDLYRREIIRCTASVGAIAAWTYRYARLDRLKPSQRIGPDSRGLCRWSRPDVPVKHVE